MRKRGIFSSNRKKRTEAYNNAQIQFTKAEAIASETGGQENPPIVGVENTAEPTKTDPENDPFYKTQ